MKKLLITLLVVCLLPISRVQALDNDVTPNAKSAILIEANSRQILYDKNAEEKLYPASTTKIMTMILMFEALRNKKYHLMMKLLLQNMQLVWAEVKFTWKLVKVYL